MRKLLPILLLLAFACAPRGGWTSAERAIIGQPDSVMHVYTMPRDSAILRAVSTDLDKRSLASPELQTLLAKMIRTVTDPSQDGVGIAAPQVGLNRRIVCVLRYDKPGEPFESFVNIHIDSLIGPKACGPEGCLSLPGLRGIVPRHQAVQISYLTPAGEPVTERVEGYTAIIFQHECDHLDGVLYTDRADSVWTVNNF